MEQGRGARKSGERRRRQGGGGVYTCNARTGLRSRNMEMEQGSRPESIPERLQTLAQHIPTLQWGKNGARDALRPQIMDANLRKSNNK